MIRFHKVNVILLVFLVTYWSLIIFSTIFLIKLGIAIIFSFMNGNFLHFAWSIECISAAKKGIVAGSILGIGIWLKAKLRERKGIKEPPK